MKRTAPQHETYQGKPYFKFAGPYRSHDTAMDKLWNLMAEDIVCEAENPIVKHNAIYFPA